MSDLYLVLRNRLEAVPEWVFIDSAVLRAAREGKGLSYETMARTIPVAAKTWERYEKAGRIPRPILGAVAETLGLEIEEPAPQRVVAIAPGDGDPSLRDIHLLLQAVDRKLDILDVRDRLVAIEERLREVAARSI